MKSKIFRFSLSAALTNSLFLVVLSTGCNVQGDYELNESYSDTNTRKPIEYNHENSGQYGSVSSGNQLETPSTIGWKFSEWSNVLDNSFEKKVLTSLIDTQILGSVTFPFTKVRSLLANFE